MQEPTPIANFTLAASIPLCAVLFSTMERKKAVAITLIGGALFLPEKVAFDIPHLNINKTSLPALVISLLVLASPKPPLQAKRGSGFLPALLVCYLITAIGTVLSNQSALQVAPGVVVAGLNITNILPKFVNSLLFYVAPFYLGERVLGDREGARTLLRVMAQFGLIYSFLMLVEIRMSPQLNVWVYGYHQHNWLQAIRDGGYRPLVFTAHGLVATMFLVLAIFSTVTLDRAGEVLSPIPAKWRIFGMLGVLALSNSLGALVYGIVFTPILWRSKFPKARKLAAWGAVVVLAYPTLRGLGIIPVEDIVAKIAEYSEERAASLGFRFRNENGLIDKWSFRPWFGFGGGDRISVYDTETGKSVTTYDGAWIIILASFGLVGFYTQFGMYLRPIWFAAKAVKSRISQYEPALIAGLSIMCFVSAFELLINGLSNNIPALTAGCLFGLVRSFERTNAATQSVAPAQTPQAT